MDSPRDLLNTQDDLRARLRRPDTTAWEKEQWGYLSAKVGKRLSELQQRSSVEQRTASARQALGLAPSDDRAEVLKRTALAKTALYGHQRSARDRG
jgi:hypothetical protein